MAKKKAVLDLKGSGVLAAIEQLNATYGKGTIIRACDASGMNVRFIRTGVHALDFVLGGGIAENRITEIRGPFSSFKSTLALMTAASFHKQYPDGLVHYCDLEKTFSPEYAASFGLDLERTQVITPDSGEQAADILNDLLGLDAPSLTILDSIAAMVPTAEVEASAEQQSMGLQARLVNKFLRVFTARMKRSLYDDSLPKASMIAINQLREKIGVVYGNPETSPGGKGKDFFYSTIVRVASNPSAAVKEEKTVGSIKRTVIYGQGVDIKVQKNKCSVTQYDEGKFTFYRKAHGIYKARTVDNVDALYSFGLFYGAIKYSSAGRAEYGKISFARKSDFLKALLKDEVMQEEIYEGILESIRQTDEVDEVVEKPVASKKAKRVIRKVKKA